MRTSLERALNGEYRYLSGVIQGYTCDVSCGLMNIWEENVQPGLFHTVPLPYNTGENAHAFYRETLNELIRKLAAAGGKINASSLERSLDLYRDMRNNLLHLHGLRLQSRLGWRSREFYTVIEACFSLPPETYNEHLKNLISNVKDKKSPQTTGIPILISGSLLEDMTIFDLLETAGGRIVADDLCNGYRFCHPADGTGTDPIERLIDRYMNRFPCPSRSFIEDRIIHFKKLIEWSGAAGVIFIFQKFCTPHLADYPALAEELKGDSIPVLQVEIDEVGGSQGQLKTRFEAFFEMIKG
jgi:benzoyl-CoA reductase subunit C